LGGGEKMVKVECFVKLLAGLMYLKRRLMFIEVFYFERGD
jgi:hypothetical protein